MGVAAGPQTPGRVLLQAAWKDNPIFRQVLNMAPKTVRSAACQQNFVEGPDVDLEKLPIQTCWPGDAGPLLTWGLVVTRGPERPRQNLGIYRQQLIGKNRLIMRWLSHRGGALDFRDWQQKHPGQPFPVAVALLVLVSLLFFNPRMSFERLPQVTACRGPPPSSTCWATACTSASPVSTPIGRAPARHSLTPL